MVAYATSGGSAGAQQSATPVSCQGLAAIGPLAGLDEASGLAPSRVSRDVFWSHNDSGAPRVSAIAADGSIVGRVTVTGAKVVDWEAVEVGPCPTGSCLYVGDIGDNDRERNSITVYRTPEPAAEATATDKAEIIEASYPEGPQDAEALFFAGDSLFVVTKGEETPVRLYRFPNLTAGSRHTLELVATLVDKAPPKPYRVTDAAASADGAWVAMRTNDMILFYRTAALLQGAPGAPLTFDLRPLAEPQGEGIAWAAAGTLYLAGESKGAGTFGRVACTLPSS